MGRILLNLIFLLVIWAGNTEAAVPDLRLDYNLPPASALIDPAAPAQHAPTPLRVLIDVRSNHSDGEHDFDTLIQLAQKRYLDAIAFNEHDRYTIRFGLEPIPHILGYSQEHPSLHLSGLHRFFDDLAQAKRTTSLTLLAGTESTPGYDWRGIPFKNLSLHNAERHMITLGATRAEQIAALPSYKLTYARGNQTLSLVLWFVFIFGLIFVLLRRRKRGVALLLGGAFIAFMSAWLIKPQHEKHTSPEQAFMQAAHTQGLFTIWAHPGTKSGVRQGPMGVWLVTPPYNNIVFQAPTADAFAAVYGDTDNNTVAGGLWDQYMMDYLAGHVGKPIWAVAAGDYHGEGQAGEYLGNYPMDVWATDNSPQAILTALRQGRMTAWHMRKQHNLSMQTLALVYSDPETGQADTMLIGQTRVVAPAITLLAALRQADGTPRGISLDAQWIVDGSIAARVRLRDDASPARVSLVLPRGRHVIRLQIPAQQGIRMEANPFLVEALNKSALP